MLAQEQICCQQSTLHFVTVAIGSVGLIDGVTTLINTCRRVDSHTKQNKMDGKTTEIRLKPNECERLTRKVCILVSKVVCEV